MQRIRKPQQWRLCTAAAQQLPVVQLPPSSQGADKGGGRVRGQPQLWGHTSHTSRPPPQPQHPVTARPCFPPPLRRPPPPPPPHLQRRPQQRPVVLFVPRVEEQAVVRVAQVGQQHVNVHGPGGVRVWKVCGVGGGGVRGGELRSRGLRGGMGVGLGVRHEYVHGRGGWGWEAVEGWEGVEGWERGGGEGAGQGQAETAGRVRKNTVCVVWWHYVEPWKRCDASK